MATRPDPIRPLKGFVMLLAAVAAVIGGVMAFSGKITHASSITLNATATRGTATVHYQVGSKPETAKASPTFRLQYGMASLDTDVVTLTIAKPDAHTDVSCAITADGSTSSDSTKVTGKTVAQCSYRVRGSTAGSPSPHPSSSRKYKRR